MRYGYGLRTAWLRKIAETKVRKAIGRDFTQLDSRAVTVPLGFLLGLIPIAAYFTGWFGDLHFTKSDNIIAWDEWLWGGTATLFALPVAVSTLVTGMSLSVDSRRTVFRIFRQRAFDSIVVLGLTYLASSSAIITRSIIVQATSVMFARILVGMLFGELFVVFGIGMMVYNAAVLLESSTDRVVQKQLFN